MLQKQNENALYRLVPVRFNNCNDEDDDKEVLKLVSIDYEKMDDEKCYTLTGLHHYQFLELFDEISHKESKSRHSLLTGLGLYLTRLRTGLSIHQLSSFFENISYDQAKRLIRTVRKCLDEDFMPKWLGFKVTSRKEVLEDHTTNKAKILLNLDNDDIVTIWDGTYIYTEKPSSYSLQKNLYSMHKHRTLVKFMMIVASDGYIIDVIGPFVSDSSNNDASMTKHILEKIEGAKNWFLQDNVFIVDRGFLDATEYLKRHNYKVRMPSFLEKKEKALSVSDANQTRIVTSLRWVVESANGRIKRWNFWRNTVRNRDFEFIEQDFKITSALINKFRSQLSKNNDAESIDTYREMLVKCQQDNPLKSYVESVSNRVSKSRLKKPEEIEFPQLSEAYIKSLTFGIYQLKQSYLYTQEHINPNGDYIFEYFSEESNLIRVKIHSRFSSTTIHSVWVLFSLDQNEEPIKHYYCTCKCGSRVVGACAHVTRDRVVLFMICA